ncbi:MAG TPA: ClpXP protease specificity-enhancing factor SspB [Stellaceae bacterium]|nr:ClpXP protease specificity-enhancing factor SspB [Stellaceae bacterium]
MAEDLFDYPQMVEAALRGVVREALLRVARDGLRGGHHFFIGFRTGAPGVELPDHLREKYPEEMAVILQHQFWGLEVDANGFAVTLSFQSKPERVQVPFAAITSFADPSVKFALQFEASPEAAPQLPAAASEAPPGKPPGEGAEIVAIDKFRKR